METELIENVDYYFDKSGLMVLTEKYHQERGYCCGHGCRYCPYSFEAVPEPKKSILLAQQQQQQ